MTMLPIMDIQDVFKLATATVQRLVEESTDEDGNFDFDAFKARSDETIDSAKGLLADLGGDI